MIPQYYQNLIANARKHWKAGNQNPKLAPLKVPRGGYEWVVSQRVVREIPDLAEDPRDLVEDAGEEREWKFPFHHNYSWKVPATMQNSSYNRNWNGSYSRKYEEWNLVFEIFESDIQIAATSAWLNA